MDSSVVTQLAPQGLGFQHAQRQPLTRLTPVLSGPPFSSLAIAKERGTRLTENNHGCTTVAMDETLKSRPVGNTRSNIFKAIR